MLKWFLALAFVGLASQASAADSTIAAMTAASAPNGTELVYCVQGGADRKCTTSQIAQSVVPIQNDSGGNYLFIGTGAGANTATAGMNNIAIGYQAGAALSTPAAGATPQGNVFLGYQAGLHTTTMRSSVFIGYQAGVLATGNGSGVEDGENTFVGALAGGKTTTSTHNSFYGEDAGRDNTTGGSNTYLGSHAGASLSTALNGVFIGQSAGDSATNTGSGNIAIGYAAAQFYQGTGNGSIFIGLAAGAGTVGSPNTSSLDIAIGYNAGTVLTSGVSDVIMGYQAGFALTTGNGNNLIGYQAGENLVGGNQNIIIGSQAGTSITTGGANIFLGTNAGNASASNGSNQFVAGGDNANFLISNVYFGKGIASATPTAYAINGTGGLGTDITAGNVNIAGGKGTGAGLGGDILLQSSPHSTTGSTQNALVERARVHGDTGGFSLGASTLTLVDGELGLPKIGASGSAPGAGGLKFEAVCGTNAGSAKLIAYAGTSTTPVTILDNIGSGVTGC